MLFHYYLVVSSSVAEAEGCALHEMEGEGEPWSHLGKQDSVDQACLGSIKNILISIMQVQPSKN